MARLRLQRDLAELARLSPWLDSDDCAVAFDGKTRFAVELCLEEALTNVISYGSPEQISADCERQGERLIVTVRDDGMEFNPLAVAEHQQPEDLAHAEVGGLGIHLIRKFAAACDFERLDGQNVFRMTFDLNH